MRSTTLRRRWLAPVVATALLLGLTNAAIGRSAPATSASFITSKAKELRAAGSAARAKSGRHGGVTVVADRLNNPRGLDLRHGALYVAEAGTGGDTCLPDDGPCVGLTSSITKVSHGRQRRVVEGLLSFAGPDGTGAIGVDDVSVARRGGGLFMIATALGCQDQLPPGLPPEVVRQNGKLLRGHAKRVVADITAFECANDPDGQGVESNPYSVYAASRHHQVVADAAGDSVLDVRNGRVSLLAVIPSSPNGTDQVPTSVTRGPDGAYYVGTLAEGAGNGGANVWRIVPGHAPEVYVGGLTAVVDIAFGPDGSLYASEFVTDWTSEIPSGAVVRVRPDGRRTVLGQGSLFLPGGVAVDRHGNLYVANWSILPATGSADPAFPADARGQVVRLRTH
jgi:SMP-30/Gluconolactonase/LRE-like region